MLIFARHYECFRDPARGVYEALHNVEDESYQAYAKKLYRTEFVHGPIRLLTRSSCEIRLWLLR